MLEDVNSKDGFSEAPLWELDQVSPIKNFVTIVRDHFYVIKLQTLGQISIKLMQPNITNTDHTDA